MKFFYYNWSPDDRKNKLLELMRKHRCVNLEKLNQSKYCVSLPQPWHLNIYFRAAVECLSKFNSTEAQAGYTSNRLIEPKKGQKLIIEISGRAICTSYYI